MLLMAACAKQSPASETAPPASAGAAPDELEGLEQQLAQRESQLQAIGVAPKRATRDAKISSGDDAAADAIPAEPAPNTAVAPSAEASRSQTGRCEQVCELATAICELEGQICGLLPRHPGEARYQAACDRAGADCRLATEACHACNAN